MTRPTKKELDEIRALVWAQAYAQYIGHGWDDPNRQEQAAKAADGVADSAVAVLKRREAGKR